MDSRFAPALRRIVGSRLVELGFRPVAPEGHQLGHRYLGYRRVTGLGRLQQVVFRDLSLPPHLHDFDVVLHTEFLPPAGRPLFSLLDPPWYGSLSFSPAAGPDDRLREVLAALEQVGLDWLECFTPEPVDGLLAARRVLAPALDHYGFALAGTPDPATGTLVFRRAGTAGHEVRFTWFCGQTAAQLEFRIGPRTYPDPDRDSPAMVGAYRLPYLNQVQLEQAARSLLARCLPEGLRWLDRSA